MLLICFNGCVSIGRNRFSLAAAGLVMTFLKFRRGRGASHKGIGSGSGSGGAEGTVVGGRFGDDALSAGKQGHGRGPSE